MANQAPVASVASGYQNINAQAGQFLNRERKTPLISMELKKKVGVGVGIRPKPRRSLPLKPSSGKHTAKQKANASEKEE